MSQLPAFDIHEGAKPSTNGSTPHTRRRTHGGGGGGHLLWIMIPLVYVMVGWSLAGDRLVSGRTEQIVEVAGISLLGLVGVFLAFHVRNRNFQIERAYSAHLEELSQRLRSLAYQDSLTELYNHRYFYEQLSHEVERANRYGRPVSVILLDLDDFKAINDTYGHLMGDKLLALVGRIIADQVRGADIAARYGGDEFAIILPDTPQSSAEPTAQKLARAIATGRTNAGSLSENLPVKASYGVACCPDEARSVSELLQLADTRLYTAKNGAARPLVPVTIGASLS